MYNVNTTGARLIKNKNTNALQVILLAPPFFFAILITFFKIMIGHKLLFFVAFIPLLLFHAALALFIMKIALRRVNNTISKIDFKDNCITLYTFSSCFYKNIIIELPPSTQIKMHPSKFDWYGQRKLRDGQKIFFNGQELYLVKDFFDDYEIIVHKLDISASVVR